MDQTKTSLGTGMAGQTAQPAAAQPKQAQATQAASTQAKPAEKQVQPVPEKKFKWWLWLIIALVAILAGIAVYLWVIPLFTS